MVVPRFTTRARDAVPLSFLTECVCLPIYMIYVLHQRSRNTDMTLEPKVNVKNSYNLSYGSRCKLLSESKFEAIYTKKKSVYRPVTRTIHIYFRCRLFIFWHNECQVCVDYNKSFKSPNSSIAGDVLLCFCHFIGSAEGGGGGRVPDPHPEKSQKYRVSEQ